MRLQEKDRKLHGPGLLMVLALGLAGGMALDRLVGAAVPPLDAWSDFRLMSEAWRLIQRFYVDQAAAQPRAMTYGAISGMIDALGDTGHSRFLSPQMVKEMGEVERNKFQGIGAEIQLKRGHVVIAVPLDGSPAQRAGLTAGDIILQVNGKEVTDQPLDQVVEEISGPAGTSVTLTILSPASGRTRQVTLTRATINFNNVTWQMLPGTNIVHLRIAAFNKGVARDLRAALSKIKDKNPAGLVLDLRNNPGGLLEEAVDAASQFLKGGNVLLVRNVRDQEKPVPVKSGGEATGIPLVALVNGGTASGAEIAAGALQDAHRARLIGQTTFGTGTVLSEFRLSDGSALLLAIEEWLTPAGHAIWHKGITPNVVVALPAGVSPLFPAAERTMNVEQLRNSGDAQLLRALELLEQSVRTVKGLPPSGLSRSAHAAKPSAGTFILAVAAPAEAEGEQSSMNWIWSVMENVSANGSRSA
jgi:carboxyl-terminal processing protease